MGALHAISACAYNIFLYYPRVGRSWRARLLQKMMAMQRDRNCLNISRGASLRAAPASATQRETSMEELSLDASDHVELEARNSQKYSI